MSKATATIMLVAALVILAAAIVVARLGREKYQVNVEASREVQAMREEAERMKRETSKLSDRLEYLKTPEFQERQVKDTLGLARPEEKLVIIKPSAFDKPEKSSGDESDAHNTQSNDPLRPNYVKWWEYFLHYEEHE